MVKLKRYRWLVVFAAALVMSITLFGCGSAGVAESSKSESTTSSNTTVDAKESAEASSSQEITEADLYAMDLMLREYLKNGDTEEYAYESMATVFSSKELDALREWRASGGVNPYADENDDASVTAAGSIKVSDATWSWNPDDKGRGTVHFTLTNNSNTDYAFVVLTAQGKFTNKDDYGDEYSTDTFIQLCTPGFKLAEANGFRESDDPYKAGFFVQEPADDVLGLVGPLKAGESKKFALGVAWFEVTELDISNEIATFTSTTIGSDSEGSISDERIVAAEGITAETVETARMNYVIPSEEECSIEFSDFSSNEVNFWHELGIRGIITNNTSDKWRSVTVWGYPTNAAGEWIMKESTLLDDHGTPFDLADDTEYSVYYPVPISFSAEYIKPGEGKEFETSFHEDGVDWIGNTEVAGFDVVAITYIADKE